MADSDRLIANRSASRIAVISMHTSPTASLGRHANGGLNVYVHEVARILSDRGIATDIFTRCTPSDPELEQLAPLSRIIYLPAGVDLDKYSLFAEVPSFANRIRQFAAIEDLSYDLLFSHYWLSGEVACLLRPQLSAGWAHVAHTLGLVKNRSLAAGDQPEPAIRIEVEKQIAAQADLLVASTQQEATDLVRLYGADADHVAVVPPGVDLSMFQPIDRDEARLKIGYGPGRVLLFVGRLERLKGVDIAIRALALLRDRAHEDVRLLILGEDSREGEESEKERLKAVAEAAGVRDRVDFLGSVAHHELPFFYSAADLCVMPSYNESFGLVALEAQACGKPVVGSDVTGLRSVVRDQVTGYLVDSHDPAAYAERIGRLLDDPELAQQMGRHGRLLAQRFSWTRTADRLQVLFEGVIARAQVRVHASARQE